MSQKDVPHKFFATKKEKQMSDDESNRTCIGCILAPCQLLWLLLWPIVCIVLGTIAGILVSIVITTAVFLITLIRTPMHIGKMLCVTVRTRECFEGHLSTIMRIIVFLLVPFVHVLFLFCITVFSASVGTLYYIGRSTKVFYKHEYYKTFKKIESNAKLEKKSYVGKYLAACHEYMQDDEVSHAAIYALKGLIALFPGFAVAALLFLPFSLAIVAITVYRLPINVYKTMKIALFTVVLKWDLRVVVLLLLPLIHTIFPLVAFVTAMVGSFCWTWYQSTENLFKGDNPFRTLNKLFDSLKEYYKVHKVFVTERCSRFDHPSGIPYGWDGRSYGLEIERILKWQRDFLVCCVVVVVEAPISLAATLPISAIKYVPSCLWVWKQYYTEVCYGDGQGCEAVLFLWPFHLLLFMFIPIGVLLCHAALIMLAVLRVFFQVPWTWTYLVDREAFIAACQVLLEIITDHDQITGNFCGDFVFFKDWKPPTHERNQRRNEGHDGSTIERREAVASYWDRFVSQCISTTASLTEEGWVALDDIQSMDPSVIQSIPGVAI